MNKIRLFFAILSLCFVFASTAPAAVMLGGGLTHEHNAAPGQTITGVMQLRNPGRAPAEIKLYQEDATADGTNRGHGRSNKSWIKLSTDRIVLAPGATQNVTYTMQVPGGAGNGSYWSYIHLEPVSAKSRESQIQQQPNDPNSFRVTIQQKVRYAVLIMANVGQGAANLTFAAPKIEPDETGKKSFGIDIQNAGNRFTQPKISLEVFNAQGNSIKTLPGESRGLLPGTRKRVNIPLTGLAPGNYKALLTAEDSGNGKAFGTDVSLNILP